MNVSNDVAALFEQAIAVAKEKGYEYITPEVVLLTFCRNKDFCTAFDILDGDVFKLAADLTKYLDQYVKVPERSKEEPKKDDEESAGDHHTAGSGKGMSESDQTIQNPPSFSAAMGQAIMIAQQNVLSSGRSIIDLEHVLHGIWGLEDSYAVYYMHTQDIEEGEFLDVFLDLKEGAEGTFDIADEDEEDRPAYEMYAPCMNDALDGVNPLIGREDELERTIQILCRKEKNNPLHIGEPGVGKTAITYGLARLINEDRVPDPLKGARIFALDLGSLLAGTQYRGDMERRLKKLLHEISQEEKPIIYIDEIHNLSGAGAVGEGSMDVSNMLKPYLQSGKIRFIGATTFEEYKKYFEKNKSLVRRFQNVEIPEPSAEETVKILNGLKKKYEQFHGVRYGNGVLEYAVSMSVKYINERFLPDKAIDLMDEAGACRKIHPLAQKSQTVGKDLVNEVLTKICRVPVESVEQEKDASLKTLEKRMLKNIYGQDQAVSQVVNAVKFSKAGLLEEQKPLSSFLFAGPTGVGKTEIAKVLAQELGVKLIRFDMSEYGEKHAISKLIGSPAGYVGYEEGGLLTEAIRKTPSCVLLLDEIEKAHPDIFHILLQVMDYATLTDNQGRKADFRNVIIIMTSNAGASDIGKTGLGFAKQDVTSEAVTDAVKRLFAPEFRNRLNSIVVFRGIDHDMAMRIADKKLGQLEQMLKRRHIELRYTKEVTSLLCQKGTSPEYGAREMDRVIQNEIKPLMVDLLLDKKVKEIVLKTKEDKCSRGFDVQIAHTNKNG